jgi:hypothetical protein
MKVGQTGKQWLTATIASQVLATPRLLISFSKSDTSKEVLVVITASEGVKANQCGWRSPQAIGHWIFTTPSTTSVAKARQATKPKALPTRDIKRAPTDQSTHSCHLGELSCTWQVVAAFVIQTWYPSKNHQEPASGGVSQPRWRSDLLICSSSDQMQHNGAFPS